MGGRGVPYLGKHGMWIPSSVGLVCAPLVVWLGERTGKVKTVDELNRPQTLFPRQ